MSVHGPTLTAFTERALFRGMCRTIPPKRARLVCDYHPEPLRAWHDLGTTCPPGWFTVTVRATGAARFRPLWLRVESDSAAPPGTGSATGPGSRQAHSVIQLRTVWFTPSPEHVGEVARQLREGQRGVFHPDVHPQFTSTHMPLSVRLPSGGYIGYPVFHMEEAHHRTMEAAVWVYRRDGDRPHVVSQEPVVFGWPTWIREDYSW